MAAKKPQKVDESNLAAGIGRGSLQWLNGVKNVRVNLRKESPDYFNIEDRRGQSAVRQALDGLGYALKDGATSIVGDTYDAIRNSFRKAEPDAVVANALKRATPSAPLTRREK